MGVSKQAAQKRFVAKTGRESDLDPSQGFSRFTPAARTVVMEAMNAAREAGNDRISTGHLVLALLSEPEGPPRGSSASKAHRWPPCGGLPPPPFHPRPTRSPSSSRMTRTHGRLWNSPSTRPSGSARQRRLEHILLALLELEDGTGVLAGVGVDKATAEASITATTGADETS